MLVTHSADLLASPAVNARVELLGDGRVTLERHDQTHPRSHYACKTHPPAAAAAAAEAVNIAKAGGGDGPDAASGVLVHDDERAQGRVAPHGFAEYFAALGGPRVVVGLLLVQLLWQACQIGGDVWLGQWTSSSSGDAPSQIRYHMAVYALLGLGSAFLVGVRAVAVATCGLRASQHLFETMTTRLLRAPLRFFDTTPIGRILNRHGTDMAAVDVQVPFAFGTLLATLFLTLCQLATAVYTVKLLGLLVGPLVWAYVALGQYCLTPSRDIARLWKVVAAPMLSHVTCCEQGVATLHAFGSGCVARAVRETHARLDRRNRVWYAETRADLWFAVRTQLLGCGVVAVVVSALVYLRAQLSPGMVGLLVRAQRRRRARQPGARLVARRDEHGVARAGARVRPSARRGRRHVSSVCLCRSSRAAAPSQSQRTVLDTYVKLKFFPPLPSPLSLVLVLFHFEELLLAGRLLGRLVGRLDGEEPALVERLAGRRVDVFEAVGPEQDAAVPARDHDRHVGGRRELEQVRQFAAGAVLAVFVVVFDDKVADNAIRLLQHST